MPRFHRAVTGDCFASIAQRFGFADYHVLYDHAQNAQIKRRRPNPNMLVPGDMVVIPDRTEREESRSTGNVHAFRAASLQVKLRIVIRDMADQPLASRPYTLSFNEETRTGTLDGTGLLDVTVPAQITTATLAVQPTDDSGDVRFQWTLDIGSLQPPDTVSGQQARLNNMGCAAGIEDGQIGSRTHAGTRRFQHKASLDESGTINTETHDRLKTDHDGE